MSWQKKEAVSAGSRKRLGELAEGNRKMLGELVEVKGWVSWQ